MDGQTTIELIARPLLKHGQLKTKVNKNSTVDTVKLLLPQMHPHTLMTTIKKSNRNSRLPSLTCIISV